MPRMSVARKTLEKLARRRSPGYPVATVAWYGPDDQYASKVAVGIVDRYNHVMALERWSSTAQDVRHNEDILTQMVAFMERHGVHSAAMADRIIGCPHEEGIDYPEGESCPQCPFWKGRDRWTGQSQAGGPRLATPEGDPVSFVAARYGHGDAQSIRLLLSRANDFGAPDPGGTGATQTFSWLETERAAGVPPAPIGRRVLASVTVTAATLTIEAQSAPRLAACRRRVEALLGALVRFERASTRSPEEIARSAPARPAGPVVNPPPELIAKIEEKMLRQWLDERVPALGGQTPRAAARTEEGRQRLRNLIEYMDQRESPPPGAFSPDYHKALQMLGVPETPAAPLDPRALSPAEREQIKARRDEITGAIIRASFEPHDPKANERVRDLTIQYGYGEVERVQTVLIRQARSNHLLTDEATHYRTYRRAFALFGADKPFVSRPEFGERITEYATLSARRKHGLDPQDQPSEREVLLADQLFPGISYWEDVAEPAVPARPAGFSAPVPGQYAVPIHALLAWGPPAADDEAHAARVAELVAQDRAGWGAAAAELARMAVDPGLLRGWPGEAASWAPYHALDALAAIGAADQAAALAALLDEPDDWLSDRLPYVWAAMGAGAEAPLWALADDAARAQDTRAIGLLGLVRIAEAHPSRRATIVRELIARLQQATQDTATYNAYLVFLLDEMGAVEARKAVREAFRRGTIDEKIIARDGVEILHS